MAVLSKKGLALFGLRLEQRVHSFLRVFDDQSFLFRSPLTFYGLFRLHQIVLSSRFSIGGMPQPGIGPGRRNGHAVANRACLPVPALGHK
jgi:hypothetical protein